MTTVIHIKDRRKYSLHPTVYIGRPSIFGNPYSIGKDGSREDVIAKHKTYFYDRLSKDGDFKEAVLYLKDKILVCYCKPLACHGDTIAYWLDYVS